MPLEDHLAKIEAQVTTLIWMVAATLVLTIVDLVLVLAIQP